MTRNIENYYKCNFSNDEKYTAEEEIRDAYECLLSKVEAIAVILEKYDYPSRGVLHVYTAVIELLKEMQKYELNIIREDQQAEFMKYKKNLGIANNTERNA